MVKGKFGSVALAFMMLCIIFANSMVIGFRADTGRDVWLSLILSMALTVPLFLIYARLVKLMPGMDIYDMAQAALGKVGARIIGLVFGVYCLHLASLTLGNYAEFMHLTSLYKTPFVVISLGLFSVSLYLAKSGAASMGKWCGIMFTISVFVMTTVILMSLGQMKMDRLQPVLYSGWEQVAQGAMRITPLHFGDAVVVLVLMDGFRKKKNSKGLFVLVILIATFLLTILFVRNVTLLGIESMLAHYFPTYEAASLIQLGSFLERIEVILIFIYVMLGIGKIAVCLVGTAKGAARLVNVPNHTSLIVPFGFLIFALSTNLFYNIEQMFNFMNVYVIYALLFQVLIPVILWITAEIKRGLRKLPAAPQEDAPALA